MRYKVWNILNEPNFGILVQKLWRPYELWETRSDYYYEQYDYTYEAPLYLDISKLIRIYDKFINIGYLEILTIGIIDNTNINIINDTDIPLLYFKPMIRFKDPTTAMLFKLSVPYEVFKGDSIFKKDDV